MHWVFNPLPAVPLFVHTSELDKDWSQEAQQGQVLAPETQGVPGPGEPNAVEVGGLREHH